MICDNFVNRKLKMDEFMRPSGSQSTGNGGHVVILLGFDMILVLSSFIEKNIGEKQGMKNTSLTTSKCSHDYSNFQ